MASLKEVKGRINSVKSTRKITSAMKMVASAKLHRAQGAIENMLPYQKKMYRILGKFLNSPDVSLDNPFALKKEISHVGIVVFSSNSSLCGGFNANVIKRFVAVADEYAATIGKENVLVYPVGKKIEEATRKLGYSVQGSYQDMANKPNYTDAADFAMDLVNKYLNGELDKIVLVYHHFKSVGSQELMVKTFLPVDLEQVGTEAVEEAEESQIPVDYIVEPSIEEFISSLLPTGVKLEIYTALLDNAASEHAARTMAMQAATDNADTLIEDLTLQYNKTRQQTITNELLDIVSGSMK